MIHDNTSKHLVYSTVRIICDVSDKEIGVGTGFFVTLPNKNGIEKTALVTNKHVVKNGKTASIVFSQIGADGNPDDANTVILVVEDLPSHCLPHAEDNIDICLIDVEGEIQKLWKDGKKPYYKSIGSDFIVLDKTINECSEIEDVIMIGYPDALIDRVNNKPIIRTGIMATSIKRDYEGRPEFMIDAACFHGSSGSPVFIRRIGLQQEQNEQSLNIGIQYSYGLVGILYAGPKVEVDGTLKIDTIPTVAIPYPHMELTMNLGNVIKAKEIVSLFAQWE